jgi:protocatechuate 3,4-dioxygenase beta subunit
MKAGSGSTAFFHLDSLGFRITTDQNCGDIEGTIDPLPLIDTFEADKLEFVSASVMPNSVTTAGNTGTISWDNVGPLHAGQTKTIEVTFLALEPAGNVATTVTNEAEVTGATFSNGRPVNDAWDDETIGLEPTASISGVVWNDNGGPSGSGTGSDGIQNGDEEGIAGVTVYICTSSPCGSGNAIATTVTDVNGNYTFASLLDGNYYTAVDTSTLPPGNAQTGDPDVPGANCGASCDNQTTNPVPVIDANDVTNIDYGYTVPNTIYGSVWHDHNGDGDLVDATGIAGVTVRLFDNGAEIGTTTTDVNGRYVFTGMLDGNYRVLVESATLPDAVEANVNWQQTYDPDATLDDQHTIPVFVEGGNIYGSYDFAYYQGGDYNISGTVYADWNSNNLLDGEPGFAAVTVTLYDQNGNVVAVTTTDANGSYTFNDLPPGTFTVVVNENNLPAQYSQSEEPENPGLPCTACTGQGTVTIGSASVSDFNFGYEPAGYATIGDFVWHDLNGDGYQNAGEPGLANITVNLYVDYGNGYQLVDSTETNGSGFYSFTNLPPGDYRAVVDTADPNLPLDAHGSSFVPTTPSFFDVSLASGQTYLAADFGFAPGGVIGNTLYWDANGNADQDAAELGIPSVTVALWVWDADAGNWTFYADTVTDAGGEYLFTGLPRGDYQVRVDTSSGPINGRTLTGDPDTNGIPCDPDPGAPWTAYCDSQHAVEIRPGQTYLGANFGYQPIGVIGDYIWLDSNGDGVQDPDEGPIAYINVWLCTTLSPCDAGTAILTTTTDTDGYYSFSNIGNGIWYVAVDESTLAAGLSATYDLDSGTTNPDGITAVDLVNAGDSNIEADFGYRYVGDYSVSGYIFDHPVDAQGDPIVRPEGPRVQTGDLTYTDVTVYLWRQNDSGGYTLIAETVTGSNGYYAFGELPPGDYAVSVNVNDPALEGNSHATHVGVYGIDAENDGMVFEHVEIENTDIQHIDFGFAGDGNPTAVTLTTLMAYTPTGGYSLLLVMLLIMMVTGGLLAAWIRRSQA